MEYRTTQVEVTPGFKKEDSFVTKKLSKTQQEALDCLAANVLAGGTVEVYEAGKSRTIVGLNLHSIRVSNERYTRWRASDGKVDATRNTMKPLVEAKLVEQHGTRYSPDYSITPKGVMAAKDGEYQKAIAGAWVPPVMRAMTPEEQRNADIEWLTSRVEYNTNRCKEQAAAIAERLEDLAASIRRAGEELTPERSRRWGSDSLYCSNGINGSIRNTVNNLRLDILTDSEANMLTSLVRLDALKGNVAVD